jgi:DNA-binding NarL/FixJ family response regulator
VLLRHDGDLAAATGCFEKAVALYEQGGAPFETARTRLDLAELLAMSGQRAAAEREARQALDTFRALGAEREEGRARNWLQMAPTPGPRGERGSSLTGRQLEILRLVALGLSNPEIAARLKLSEHTVKRHVANLLTRLGLPSRAAAVAYAARQGLL